MARNASSPVLALFLALSLAVPAAASRDFAYRAGDPSQPYIPQTGPSAPTSATWYKPLSGTWHLQKGKDQAFQVDVPGCWPSGEGAITLSTTFRIPEEYQDRHLHLVFWGARRHLSIKVNGRLVEAWDADWPTFDVELPRWLLRFDRPNDLEVEVHDELSARQSIPLKPKLYDSVPYSGLFSDVAFVAGPTIGVEDLDWDVRLRDNYSVADWTISFSLRNHRNANIDSVVVQQLSVRGEWVSPDGQSKGHSEPISITIDAVERIQGEVHGSIEHPRLWTIEDPNLYSFRLVFQQKDSLWSIPLRFGLNEFRWEPEGVLLNGKRIQIRGVDLRQETFQHGIALTTDEVRADLERIRNLGFNLVRVVGDPPHPSTTRICDELGLLLVPQLGLRGVPETIFHFAPFHDRLSKMLTAMVRREGMHPCVAAWGLISWAPPTDAVVADIGQLAEGISKLDKRPLMVGFAINGSRDLPDHVVGVAERSPYLIFEPLPPMRSRAEPWLIGGLGSFATRQNLAEDSIRGQVRQSDALLHQLKAARAMPSAGFIIDGYADRFSALPMLVAGGERLNNEIARGLMTSDREKRIAWQKVGDAMGQLRIEAPTLEMPQPEFPIIFPLATMAVGGFLLLMMRQNNVFRHNLQRMFAHTHGFFVDIRDKRYFQSGQTFLVALLYSAGSAIFEAGWLHHSRSDFGLDYLLTLVVPFFQVKARLVEWAWQPLQGILAFTLINYLGLVLLAFLLRVMSIPFRGSLSMKQTFSLVAWASTNFLLLIPLGLIHYRFLDFNWFLPALLFVCAIFFFWFLARIVSMIRIGYRVTIQTAWMIFLFMIVMLAGTALLLYRSGYAMPEYLDFYAHVISPWVRG
ncbi:MAG: glycoside hydrolase family 2 TIM barrel-domain containing protein [bacterium]